MGKVYLRYVQKSCFGVIASPACPALLLRSGKLAISAALSEVCVWNLKQSLLIARLSEGKEAEVTFLHLTPSEDAVAVGYADGCVKIFCLTSHTCRLTFKGHSSAITSLHFTEDGTLLASGSADTTVVVWDIVGESGLYRLKGHKNAVTQVHLLSKTRHLISSAKDTHVKVWDLATQHCVQTSVAHRDEVLCFAVNSDETRLVSASADNAVIVWELAPAAALGGAAAEGALSDDLQMASVGHLKRESAARPLQLQFNASDTLLTLLAADKSMEVFVVLTQEEAAKRHRKRVSRKRLKEKIKAGGEAACADVEVNKAADEFVYRQLVKLSAKTRSFAYGVPTDKKTQPYLLTHENNALQVISLDVASKTLTAPDTVTTIDLHGHRTGIRAVSLSSDNSMLMSASQNMVKIWNTATLQCLHSLPCGYALCASFLPGDRHVVVGTKEGTLELYDITSAHNIGSVAAHKGAVWGLRVAHDNRGVVSCGADGDVVSWRFELVKDDQTGLKHLALAEGERTHLESDALCVAQCGTGKYIAAALMDATVKVYFRDTMKFYLSLYGHKLPVLCIDMSSDGTLLVSGSADKNIKIWGLDFGDCHRSLFAHTDSVMQVAFVKNTHFFFSAGKDRMVKYWDADKFEHVMTLSGHFGEVWGLAVSSDGEMVVSCAQDRSIRVWERTDEQLFLEEERELELEAAFEKSLEESTRPRNDDEEETGTAGKQTIETIKGTESIAFALDVAKEELALAAKNEKADTPNPILMGATPQAYVLRVIRSIPPSQLNHALLGLSFASAVVLLRLVAMWVKEGLCIELACRTCFFLLGVHQSALRHNPETIGLLADLQTLVRTRLVRMKDKVGTNLAGLSLLKRHMDDSTEVTMEYTNKIQEARKKIQKKMII